VGKTDFLFLERNSAASQADEHEIMQDGPAMTKEEKELADGG